VEKTTKPDIRYLNDMKLVLYDQKWAKTAPNFELYYMHRGIKQKGEFRYDITVIPPKMLGKEFIKTKGHYHIGKHKEIYQVLKGQAVFLMQKGENEIKDVYAVKAKEKEWIIIPSYYGHITINPSQTKTLKIANWVSCKCKSNYTPIQRKKGAGYFYTKNGWKKNKNYKKVPKLRFEKSLKKAGVAELADA